MKVAYSLFESGVRLHVKARPAINKQRDLRFVEIADGQSALEVCVNAAPEDGKANKAIIARLAEALQVRVRDITLKSGPTSRIKLFEIEGDPQKLEALLKQL